MLGEKILLYYQKKGISEREFAKLVGIAPEQINRYVNGKNTPTMKTWSKILSALPDFEKVVNIDQPPVSSSYGKMLTDAYDETIRSKDLYIKTLEETVSLKEKTIQNLSAQIKDLQRIIEGHHK
jgi:transcriptional regulator with XRE-family HTH domain